MGFQSNDLSVPSHDSLLPLVIWISTLFESPTTGREEPGTQSFKLVATDRVFFSKVCVVPDVPNPMETES